MNDCEREALNIIQGYPMMDAAFRGYIIYICNKVPEDEREWYDLFKIVSERNAEQLARVECWLSKAANIVGLNAEQFAQQFDFRTLRTDDPEKLYDVLAEPLVVIDLHQIGFGSIKKLPEAKTSEGSRKVAEFTAILGGHKFAIEVKTRRPEKAILEIGRMSDEEAVEAVISGRTLLGEPTKAYWWWYKCKDDIIRKIEEKNRRVIEQLDNTCKDESADRKMLVIYSRRHSYSWRMGSGDYLSVLKCVKSKENEIDYLGYKAGFDEKTVIYPSLPSRNTPH